MLAAARMQSVGPGFQLMVRRAVLLVAENRPCGQLGPSKTEERLTDSLLPI